MTAAQDLQDYFFKSMDMSLKLKKGEACANSISYDVNASVTKDAFILEVSENGIKITGNMSKDAFCGSVYVEDQLNLREAPYIAIQTLERKKLFTPRIVHSGWGIELFPTATSMQSLTQALMPLLFSLPVLTKPMSVFLTSITSSHVQKTTVSALFFTATFPPTNIPMNPMQQNSLTAFTAIFSVTIRKQSA